MPQPTPFLASRFSPLAPPPAALPYFAIAALKENEQFDNLNNLTDERGNIVDVYICFSNDLSQGREAQCEEIGNSITISYRGRTKTEFIGFKDNKVNIVLGGKNIGLNACHEGGHLEYDVPNFTAKCQWEKAHGCDYPEYGGHLQQNGKTIDPSGIKAEEREQQYKNRLGY